MGLTVPLLVDKRLQVTWQILCAQIPHQLFQLHCYNQNYSMYLYEGAWHQVTEQIQLVLCGING